LSSSDHPLLPTVILAGGLATRLGTLTRDRPKCLVDVNGEPFLFHQLRALKSQGGGRVLMCLGYLGEQVVEAVGDGSAFRLEVEYAFDGPNLLGTAGAIRRVIDRLQGSFFVLYGDSYLECDYAAAQTAFQDSGKLAMMTIFANQEQWDSSNVEFSGGRILAYDKVDRNPAMRHIDYGLGLFDSRAFEVVPEGKAFDLAQVYQAMLLRDQLAALEVFERFYEVGSYAGLEETRWHLAARTKRTTPSGE
jgi:NDP-sugar pyrophosphorylase family protein